MQTRSRNLKDFPVNFVVLLTVLMTMTASVSWAGHHENEARACRFA